MRGHVAAAGLAVLLLAAPCLAQEFECVTTEWKILGANHKVCVYSFADPALKNVTC